VKKLMLQVTALTTPQNMYRLKVDEPWLSLIATGAKTVEWRSGPADQYTPWIAQTVAFYHPDSMTLFVKIVDVRHYDTLYDYLDAEGFQAVAPHLATYEETVDAYHAFYSDVSIRERGGMNALQVEVVE
jgi:ASC-1-like (ASCH) protein